MSAQEKQKYRETIARAEAAARAEIRFEPASAIEKGLSPTEWIAARQAARPTIAQQQGGQAGDVEKFKQIIEGQSAHCHRIADEAALFDAIEEIAQNWHKKWPEETGPEPVILTGEDEIADRLSRQPRARETAPRFERFDRKKAEAKRKFLGLSFAKAAASETGTLFLTSGNENPTPLNFLSACHIVVIKAEMIYQTFEAAYTASLAEVAGRANMPPRAVNLISGPSRTADIEQALTLGAHGPIELHVIVWGE